MVIKNPNGAEASLVDGQLKWILGLGLATLMLYLSGFLVWLTPLPIIYGYKKGGRSRGIIPLLGALVLLLVLYLGIVPVVLSKLGAEESLKYLFWVPGWGGAQSPPWHVALFGICYFLFYGLVGVLLGEREPSAENMTQLTGVVVGLLLLGLGLLLILEVGTQWQRAISGLENYFSEMIGSMIEMAESSAPMEPQLAFLNQHRDTMVYYAIRLLPGMILSTMIFITWLNVIAARKLFFREKMFPRMGPLKNWRMPFAGIWVVIGTAGLLLTDIYWLHIGTFKLIALNAFICFGLIYFFQGLAIVAFFGERWSLSPLIKLIFYVLFIIFFQPIGILLLAFGFFDSWFDFRKMNPKPKAG